MRKVRTSGSKGDGTDIPGETAWNAVVRKALGNGNRTLPLMPFSRASSMDTQRSIPRLCTTTISGASGESRGSRIRMAS